jgi:polygalacturonase
MRDIYIHISRLYKRFRITPAVIIIFAITSCQPVISQKTGEVGMITTPFGLLQVTKPTFPDREFDIRSFGAKEGGIVKNTDVFNEAIKRATTMGGGTIIVPEGKWLTGAIHLDNNINLHLEKGAELLFSHDFKDYLPVVFSRHEDLECYKYSAFIYAEGKTNIAITGEGVLNGQGNVWWDFKKSKKNIEQILNEMAVNDVPVEKRIFDGTNGKELRPAFFQPMNCSNVLVEGVTFLYGAFWTITPTYCQNVIVRKVHIVTEGSYGHTPNGDGVDPSSCKNVLIEDCEFDTGDDCVAIKAGRDRDGLRVNKPTENIVIRNCRGLRGHGGIVIGSETSGSIRNIYAVNNQFSGTDRIVRIKTARGRGGIIENMWFSDLIGENIVMEALHINMLYTGERLPAQPVVSSTPSIRNIHFENIQCRSGKSYAIEILGLPEMPVKTVTFSNIVATTEKGINIADANDVSIMNSNFTTSTIPAINILESQNVTIDSSEFHMPGNQLLYVNGASSQHILLRKIPRSNNDNDIVRGVGVSPNAVEIRK